MADEYGLAEVCHQAADLECASKALDSALKLAPGDPKAQLLKLVETLLEVSIGLHSLTPSPILDIEPKKTQFGRFLNNL